MDKKDLLERENSIKNFTSVLKKADWSILTQAREGVLYTACCAISTSNQTEKLIAEVTNELVA